jgi:hypothetical protein
MEYGFVLNFPAILVNSVGNVLYYLATESNIYVTLFLTFGIIGLTVWVLAFLLSNSMGTLKIAYEKLIKGFE